MRRAARTIVVMLLAVIGVTALQAQADKTSIGGSVVNAGTGKPEAGVWVIAETRLPVAYRKIGSINHIQLRPNPLSN